MYMQARYYDPVIGRFYSNDPVDAFSHLGTPNGIHGFNRYAYANNNPYMYTDPTGKSSDPINSFRQWANMHSSAQQKLKSDLNDTNELAGDIVASEGVQASGEFLGFVPVPQAQAAAQLINAANTVLNGDASGSAGDIAGALTDAATDGKGKITQTFASVIVSTVVSAIVETIQGEQNSATQNQETKPSCAGDEHGGGCQ